MQIYIYLMIAVFVIIAVYVVCKEKCFANPVFCFNMVWTAVFYYSFVNVYVVTPLTTTYILIFSGVLLFDIGFFLAKTKIKHIRLGNSLLSPFKGQFVLRYRIFYISLCLCILYYFSSFIFLLKNVGSFNLASAMRYINASESLSEKSRLLNFLNTLFINPFSFIAPIIAAVDYWLGKKDKIVLFGTLVMLLLRLLSSGNRLSFLVVFIYFILIAELLNNEIFAYTENFKKMKKKRKRIVIVALAVAVIVFFITTISRGYEIKHNLTINLAIPMRLFEIWSNSLDEASQYAYGLSSLQGFIYPLFYILKNSIGLPIPNLVMVVYDTIQSTVTQSVNAGTYLHNAYVSAFWFFYYDFRVLGVLLGSFVFGYISNRIYIRAKKYRNCKIVAMYCVFINSILMSYGNLSFSNISTGVGIILILFVLYKKRTGITDNRIIIEQRN